VEDETYYVGIDTQNVTRFADGAQLREEVDFKTHEDLNVNLLLRWNNVPSNNEAEIILMSLLNIFNDDLLPKTAAKTKPATSC
jgi:hypothetical protein